MADISCTPWLGEGGGTHTNRATYTGTQQTDTYTDTYTDRQKAHAHTQHKTHRDITLRTGRLA